MELVRTLKKGKSLKYNAFRNMCDVIEKRFNFTPV